VADVSDEAQVLAFARAVADEHDTDHINLLFNNAGIGGGGSFVTTSRERVGAHVRVCWGGVYNVHPRLPADAAGEPTRVTS
jgi:NAD(P)-dependent dehydrogenase (short-subunit alcohol dehydrogenase family)